MKARCKGLWGSVCLATGPDQGLDPGCRPPPPCLREAATWKHISPGWLWLCVHVSCSVDTFCFHHSSVMVALIASVSLLFQHKHHLQICFVFQHTACHQSVQTGCLKFYHLCCYTVEWARKCWNTLEAKDE